MGWIGLNGIVCHGVAWRKGAVQWPEVEYHESSGVELVLMECNLVKWGGVGANEVQWTGVKWSLVG